MQCRELMQVRAVCSLQDDTSTESGSNPTCRLLESMHMESVYPILSCQLIESTYPSQLPNASDHTQQCCLLHIDDAAALSRHGGFVVICDGTQRAQDLPGRSHNIKSISNQQSPSCGALLWKHSCLLHLRL